jgi:hypothetical protein
MGFFYLLLPLVHTVHSGADKHCPSSIAIARHFIIITMGQTASKVAKSVVSKSRTVGKGPASASGAAAASPAIDPNSPEQPQPPQRHQASSSKYISDEIASSYPSGLDHRDAIQRRFLEEKAGSLEYKEMPQDLVDFLKKAGPLRQRPSSNSSVSGSGGDNSQEVARKLRLPRHLRDLEDKNSNNSNEQQQPSLSTSSSSPRGSGGPDERQVESMRLVKNIPGFETSRSTNFSTRPAANDNDDPTIFQAGQVLDIYDMIMLLRQRKEEAASSASNLEHAQKQQQEEVVVQEIYQQYAKKFAIPEEDIEQERHLELLRKTLAYLEVPVILKDTSDGSYDGVYPEQVADFELLGGVIMPPTSVKNVLQDFSDMRKKDSETSSNNM